MSLHIIDLDLYDFLGAFVVLSLFVYIIKYMLFLKNAKKRYWIYPISILYILALIEVTMLPIEILSEPMLKDIFGTEEGMAWQNYIQLKPFTTLLEYYRTGNIYQLVGNVLLLAPFPFLISLFYEKISVIFLCSSSFFLSLIIEISQFVIDITTRHLNRVCDIDDIILNTGGAVFTSIIIFLLRKTNLYTKLYRLCVYRNV